MNFTKLIGRTVLAVAAGSLLSTAVLAQEYDNRPNIYTGGNYHFFDSEINQEDDLGWVFGGEVPVAERWGVALEQFLVETDVEGAPGDAELKRIRLGANYYLAQRGLWQPYISAGLGYYRLKPSLPSQGPDEGSVDFGVGVKRFLGDNFFLRGDANVIRIQNINNWDQTVSLGLGYAFGPKRSAPVQQVAAPVVAADPDSDGDGVPDSRDRCPNTPRNLAVDSDGCPIMDSSMLSQELTVTFDFDQAVIKPEFYAEVAEFAEFMTTYSNTDVVIEGYTDSVGTEAYNQNLSERRTQAVMNRLISQHGIAASRLSAVGYGEARPVADNATADGRARNRRIMAEVSVQVQQERPR